MAPLRLLNSGGRTIAGPSARQASVAGVTPQSALAGIPSRPISAWRLNAYFQIEAGDDGRRIREKVTGKGDDPMKNVQMMVEGDILTITVDLSKEFGPSSSGKTIIIASTEGNVSVPDREEKVGLNVYRKK
jgi:hypothetical protein